MGFTTVTINDFINFLEKGNVPVVDARSESEFHHARVPGAVSIPLLNDQERKIVGTIYKQKGKEEAVLEGFRLVGPRFHEIISKARELTPGKEVILYCWRGGMRSEILAWVLQLNGFKVLLLQGGYKAFRNWALEVMQQPIRAIILGGPTGSGKTEILNVIKNKGQQVLDLEALANHKGSAFGGLGKAGQPSNEQFENMIALQWNRFDSTLPVWIENESRAIGSCLLPAAVYELIRNSDLLEIHVGDARRKQRILDEYGVFPATVLGTTTEKIAKRLGPQHLKQALLLLDSGDINGWLEIVLGYYDKLYAFGSMQRDKAKCFRIDLEQVKEALFADQLIQFAHEQFNSNKLLKEQ